MIMRIKRAREVAQKKGENVVQSNDEYNDLNKVNFFLKKFKLFFLWIRKNINMNQDIVMQWIGSGVLMEDF